MAINPYSSGSPFGVDGIISGLRTSDIIGKLMNIERMPLTKYAQQRQKIQLRDAAYQDIKSKLTVFQGALTGLFAMGAINGRTTSVTAPTGSNPSLTASATSDAVAGAYTVNVTQMATASTVSTSRPISRGVSTGVVLNSAGFNLAPTAGTFTVNGVSISIDPTVDTLTSVVNKITDTTQGGTGVGTGVRATIVNDANGNPNYIQITPTNPATAAVQLGSGSDTSNFLTAAHLVSTNVAGGSVTSTAPLSAATPGNALSLQPFNLPTGFTLAASGSFTINGTTITWQNTDSLTTVLNRINASSANVKASYDPSADKVTLTNLTTGNQLVSVSEVASPPNQSGFLAALGLVGGNAVNTAGRTAQYTLAVNGGAAGPVQYSNSNNITNAVTGLNLTLTSTGTSTVTVAQDTGSASKNVQALVDAFNGLQDSIANNTKYDPKTKKAQPLSGDASILGLQARIRSLLFAGATVPSTSAYKTLNDIGVSTGGYGAAVGSTDKLTLDQTKFTAALQSNPSAVFNVLSGLAGTATLTNAAGQPVGTGNSWLQSISGSPTGVATSGTYAITYNPAGGTSNLSSVFTPLGSSSATAVTGSITAGGSNSMIGGLTLTAKGTVTSGTEYVTYNVTTAGVLQGVNSYLTTVLQTGGMFDSKSTSNTAQLKYIDDQVARFNARMDQRQQSLQAQFTRMEQVLAKLQGQSSALAQKLGNTPTQ